MTERLYYTEPFLREFDASICAVDRLDDRLVVTLNRTAFYPTSGGQPFDTGVLGALRVTDVFDRDDETIGHVIEAPAGTIAIGESVHGVIDWSRRFDHMQQHTGQHVLSAIIERLHQVPTVGFHLGTESSTIDLARELTAREMAAAEDDANQAVWEDRAISIRFASADEASRLQLRKEPVRTGILRVIEIEGVDLSACGGTHVARTGAVGVIAVASWERFKGGQRLEFLCGGRALKRFRALRDTTASIVALLSSAPGELVAVIETMQAAAQEQRRTIAALQGDLTRYRADAFASTAEAGPAGRLVLRSIDADAATLKALASVIVERRGYLVVLVSSARPARVVVARSSDLAVSASTVLAALTAKCGGRGGGRPEFAQGGGLDATTDEILAAARTAISG
jgi:alanyl-tRNA synthetase